MYGLILKLDINFDYVLILPTRESDFIFYIFWRPLWTGPAPRAGPVGSKVISSSFDLLIRVRLQPPLQPCARKDAAPLQPYADFEESKFSKNLYVREILYKKHDSRLRFEIREDADRGSRPTAALRCPLR